MSADTIQDEPAAESREPRKGAKRPLAWRLFRGWLITNAVLLTVIGGGLWGGHRWIAASEENFEAAINYASKHPVKLASLVEDHKFNPRHIEKLARASEILLLDSARLGSKTEAHLYWQGRLLMTFPILYATLGLTDKELERREQALALFTELAERNPTKADYRRRLAVTNNLQAETLQKLGRHESAIGHWRRQREIADGLLREEPTHWRWRSYVAMSEFGIAESLSASGNADASVHLTNARRVASELCRERPQDDRLCALAARVGKSSAGSGAPRPSPGPSPG